MQIFDTGEGQSASLLHLIIMSRSNTQKQFSSFQRPSPRQGSRPSGTGAWRSAPQNPQNNRNPQKLDSGHGQRKSYQNSQNHHNNHTNNKHYHQKRNTQKKVVFLNSKPRHAGAGLDFVSSLISYPGPLLEANILQDNDTTMTRMPSPYSAKQWRRIQYLRQLRDTHQYLKLHQGLNSPDQRPPQDVDMTRGTPKHIIRPASC